LQKKKKKKKPAAGIELAQEAAAAKVEGEEGVEGDEGDEGDEGEGAEGGEGASTKKKKKKKKKKKSGGGGGGGGGGGAKGVPSKENPSRGVTGFTDYYVAFGQTEPPTIPVSKLFPPGSRPQGEIQEHPGDFNTYRISSEEKRAAERQEEDLYDNVRLASEVHRQVRHWSRSFIKPGIKLTDMCELLENKNRELIEESGLQAGIGFPTGCSINHVAAHYTPNVGDDTVLQYGDVMKIDFGSQIDGRIIDCAWTVSFDPKFDNLIEATKMATDAGIRVRANAAACTAIYVRPSSTI
jgi:methionyl aminopeptidase